MEKTLEQKIGDLEKRVAELEVRVQEQPQEFEILLDGNLIAQSVANYDTSQAIED